MGGDRRQLAPQVGHWAERHGLIVLVALGETIISLGTSRGLVGDPPITWSVLVGSALAVVVVTVLWWTYFDIARFAAEQALARPKGSPFPGGPGRLRPDCRWSSASFSLPSASNRPSARPRWAPRSAGARSASSSSTAGSALPARAGGVRKAQPAFRRAQPGARHRADPRRRPAGCRVPVLGSLGILAGIVACLVMADRRSSDVGTIGCTTRSHRRTGPT